MKRRGLQAAAGALGMLLLLNLAGCSGNGSSSSSAAASYNQSADYSMEDYESASSTAEAGTETGMEQELAAVGRKLITTAHITAETEDYDEAMAWVEQELAQAGGYAENSETYAYNLTSRSCQMTLRVPADRLDSFLAALDEHCNVVERSIQEDDVTLDYVDTESHKEALLVEQERLLELLAQANKLEDILSIEDRLTQVRYQLQNYESALRTYDSQIEYSTIHISLQEVRELTEPEPESWGSRAVRGMRENAKAIAVFFQELGLLVVAHLPVLGLLGVVAALALLFTRKPRRAARERRRLNKEAVQARQREYLAAMEKNAPPERKQ